MISVSYFRWTKLEHGVYSTHTNAMVEKVYLGPEYTEWIWIISYAENQTA